jgi:membrane associated rhomboid family serine protease
MVILPTEIETLRPVRPWMNGLIVLAILAVSSAQLLGWLDPAVAEQLVLHASRPAGLFGHVLLHGNWVHLLGNLVFLAVFGNAVCSNLGNGLYTAVFGLVTLLAAGAHLILDGSPALGASGAINGVTGLVLALYPLNRVHMIWFFFNRGGECSCPAWMLIAIWFAFDVWGVITGSEGVGYWAHLGGLISGLGLGILFLKRGWFELTCDDNPSLLELLARKGLGKSDP